MASPYYFRRGWDREKLAEYILSRFAFVAKPSTVSDDLGSDLFCTLFRLEKKVGVDYPLPLSSFAIQIKSNDTPFDFSPNINYLQNLEIPFFLGVLDESTKELLIFSGEYLPRFFSHVGAVQELRIKPLKRSEMQFPYDPPEGRKEKYTVMFPMVIKIGIDSNRKELEGVVEQLRKMCSLIHRNISTRKIGEYIFEEFDERSYYILAGPDSVNKFRDNFMKRLAENFYNLEWLYKESNAEEKEELIKEFKIYEEIYLKLRILKRYSTIHGILTSQYEDLKTILFA